MVNPQVYSLHLRKYIAECTKADHHTTCPTKKRQRSPNGNMKDIFQVCLVVAFGLPTLVNGQNEAFTRQEACPGDASLTGYTSIPNLNDDMSAELQRIQDGGDPPEGGYNLVLCPGGNFDAAGGNSIKPVLDQVSITCGGPDSTDPLCVINGGGEQLLIQDSTVDGYTVSSVTVTGLTFSGFTGVTSATLSASEPTLFTCIDCIWQDFDGSDFVADLSGSMTMLVRAGTVRVCILNGFGSDLYLCAFSN